MGAEHRRVVINGATYEALLDYDAENDGSEIYFTFKAPHVLTFGQAIESGLLRKVSDAGLTPTTPRTTFGFRMEVDKNLTEQDLGRMIGETMPVQFFGRNVPAKITNAHHYDDPMLGPGIWIEAEYVGS